MLFFYLLLTQWDFTLAVVNKWNPFLYLVVNPLTPVPPINVRDKPWPFFHFWCHLFWPKLSSSILNFCRRKRSFQWCPDQSDRPNGALDVHKNAQKVEWKTWSKISCHYTWMLHAKRLPVQGTKLRLIQSPMRLRLPLWRPRFKN